MSFKSMKAWIEESGSGDLPHSRIGSKRNIYVCDEEHHYDPRDEKNPAVSFVLRIANMTRINIGRNEPIDFVCLERHINKEEKTEFFERTTSVGDNVISFISKNSENPSTCYWETSFDRNIDREVSEKLERIYGSIVLHQDTIEDMVKKSRLHKIDIYYVEGIFLHAATLDIKVEMLEVRVE